MVVFYVERLFSGDTWQIGKFYKFSSFNYYSLNSQVSTMTLGHPLSKKPHICSMEHKRKCAAQCECVSFRHTRTRSEYLQGSRYLMYTNNLF